MALPEDLLCLLLLLRRSQVNEDIQGATTERVLESLANDAAFDIHERAQYLGEWPASLFLCLDVLKPFRTVKYTDVLGRESRSLKRLRRRVGLLAAVDHGEEVVVGILGQICLVAAVFVSA